MGIADKNSDLSGIVENDHLFHKTIVDEAGLKRLSRLWSGFDGENAAAYYTMDRAHLMPHNYIEYNHRLIIEALKSQDLDRIIDVISEHYMVVPRDLYRHNSAEPGKLTEIGRLR